MTIWAIGINGICYPSTYGYMLGQDGYNGIWLEHHWNNPLKKAGMTDSSGIRFYITDNIRNRTAAMAIWGPLNLGLPVGVRDFEQSGSCPSTCTKDIEEPIYFVELIPHMHYYGRYITAVHVRPGEFERVILDKVPYAYDNPDWIMLDPPLEFRPGDEMRVSCLFTTTSATKPTFFGLGTFDEMCFLLAAYYQVSPSVPVVCGADKAGVGFCGEKMVGFTDECDYSMLDRDATMYYDKITGMYGVCDTTGVTCKPLCKDAIEALKASHPCFTGPVGPTLLASFRWFDATIANMLLSCTEAPNQPAGGAGHEHGMEGSTGSSSLCPVGISPSSATRPATGLCCTVLLLLKALSGLLQ
jgi:hypothetical protein